MREARVRVVAVWQCKRKRGICAVQRGKRWQKRRIRGAEPAKEEQAEVQVQYPAEKRQSECNPGRGGVSQPEGGSERQEKRRNYEARHAEKRTKRGKSAVCI